MVGCWCGRTRDPFSNYAFHPVVFMPEVYDIRDFTTMDNANRMPTHPYSVGKYDEDRAGMYTHELFEGMRMVHMGIDIGTPVHIAHAFWDGDICVATTRPTEIMGMYS